MAKPSLELSAEDLPDFISKEDCIRFLCYRIWHKNPNLTLKKVSNILFEKYNYRIGSNIISKAISHGLSHKWGYLVNIEK